MKILKAIKEFFKNEYKSIRELWERDPDKPPRHRHDIEITGYTAMHGTGKFIGDQEIMEKGSYYKRKCRVILRKRFGQHRSHPPRQSPEHKFSWRI